MNETLDDIKETLSMGAAPLLRETWGKALLPGEPDALNIVLALIERMHALLVWQEALSLDKGGKLAVMRGDLYAAEEAAFLEHHGLSLDEMRLLFLRQRQRVADLWANPGRC
jgi:hypothetical protein